MAESKSTPAQAGTILITLNLIAQALERNDTAGAGEQLAIAQNALEVMLAEARSEVRYASETAYSGRHTSFLNFACPLR